MILSPEERPAVLWERGSAPPPFTWVAGSTGTPRGGFVGAFFLFSPRQPEPGERSLRAELAPPPDCRACRVARAGRYRHVAGIAFPKTSPDIRRRSSATSRACEGERNRRASAAYPGRDPMKLPFLAVGRRPLGTGALGACVLAVAAWLGRGLPSPPAGCADHGPACTLPPSAWTTEGPARELPAARSNPTG